MIWTKAESLVLFTFLWSDFTLSLRENWFNTYEEETKKEGIGIPEWIHMIAHLTFSVLSWSNMEKLCPRNYFQQVESRSEVRTSYERTETTSKGALASFVSDPCDSKGHFSPRPKSQEEDDVVELKNSWLNVNFTSGRQSTGNYDYAVLC